MIESFTLTSLLSLILTPLFFFTMPMESAPLPTSLFFSLFCFPFSGKCCRTLVVIISQHLLTVFLHSLNSMGVLLPSISRKLVGMILLLSQFTLSFCSGIFLSDFPLRLHFLPLLLNAAKSFIFSAASTLSSHLAVFRSGRKIQSFSYRSQKESKPLRHCQKPRLRYGTRHAHSLLNQSLLFIASLLALLLLLFPRHCTFPCETALV